MALPIPEDAPVMRATLSFKLNKSVNVFTIYDYVDLRFVTRTALSVVK
jgi:hypothetical protein